MTPANSTRVHGCTSISAGPPTLRYVYGANGSSRLMISVKPASSWRGAAFGIGNPPTESCRSSYGGKLRGSQTKGTGPLKSQVLSPLSENLLARRPLEANGERMRRHEDTRGS